MSYVLLISIVPHGKGELINSAAVKAGSFGGTIAKGRGISANGIAAALGIESSKDLVFILTDENMASAIKTSIINATSEEKNNFGCLFSVQANSMLKTGIISGVRGEESMNEDNANELISVILNKGYADDAMSAARKAGAGGGTVINARGTAREDDAKFFGMHIVPEKEMLLIVVKASQKDSVLEAIRTLPCLEEPGSGIAYCTGVNSFTLLGRKNNA